MCVLHTCWTNSVWHHCKGKLYSSKFHPSTSVYASPALHLPFDPPQLFHPPYSPICINNLPAGRILAGLCLINSFVFIFHLPVGGKKVVLGTTPSSAQILSCICNQVSLLLCSENIWNAKDGTQVGSI